MCEDEAMDVGNPYGISALAQRSVGHITCAVEVKGYQKEDMCWCQTIDGDIECMYTL